MIVAGKARTSVEIVARFYASILAADLNIRLLQRAEGVSGSGDVVLRDSDSDGAA